MDNPHVPSRRWYAATVTLLLLWLALAAASFGWAYALVGKPFPGFLLERNRTVAVLGFDDWAGPRAGLRPSDRLVALDGRPLTSANALMAEVAAHPAGTAFRYRLERDGRPAGEVVVASSAFTWWDFSRAFLAFWTAGLIHLVIGFVVLLLRPHHAAAQAHWGFCLAMALFCVLNFESASTYHLTDLSFLSFGLLAVAVLHLGITFPTRLFAPRTRRWLLGGSWAAAGATWLAYGLAFERPEVWAAASLAIMAAPSAAFLVLAAIWAWTAGSRRFDARARSQARVVMAGVAVSFLPMIAAVFLPAVDRQRAEGFGISEFPLALFPFFVGWAIVRHQAFDLALILRRTTVYVALTAALATVYVGLATVGGALFPLGDLAGGPTSAPGFLASLGVAAAFRPLHDGLRRLVDRAFLGERVDAIEAIRAFSRRELGDAPAIAAAVADLLRSAFAPRWIRLAAADVEHADGPVPAAVRALASDAPEADAVRVAREAAPNEPEPLAVGLAVAGERLGLLLVGPRANQVPYDAEQGAMIAVLGAHAASALRLARLIEERVDLLVASRVHGLLAEERAGLLRQVVHDLRTDLFNIVLATRLAGREPGEPRHHEEVVRAVKRIEALLAEKARWLEEGAVGGEASLAEALAGVGEVIAGQLAGKRLELEIERPAGDVLVAMSRVAVEQVLVNLLTNAAKASPEGGLVRLTVHATPAAVAISVADEGPGLPPGFAPGEAGTPRPDGGVGLGLGNALALLRRAGGALRWSDGGRGACFVAEIPMAIPGGNQHASEPRGVVNLEVVDQHPGHGIERRHAPDQADPQAPALAPHDPQVDIMDHPAGLAGQGECREPGPAVGQPGISIGVGAVPDDLRLDRRAVGSQAPRKEP